MLIVDITLSLVESFAYYYFFFRVSVVKKTSYTWLIVLAVWITLSNNWFSIALESYYRTGLGMLIVMWITYFITCKSVSGRAAKMILIYVLFLLVTLVTNIIALLVVGSLGFIGYMYEAIGTVIAQSLCILISIIANQQLSNFIGNLRRIAAISKKELFKYMAVFCIIIGVGLVGVWLHFNIQIKNEVMLYAASTLACLTFYLVYNLKRNMEHSLEIYELQQQILYTKSYSDVVEKLKHFSHNYGNVIQTLAFCVQDETITREELLTIISETLAWDQMYDAKNAMKLMEIRHPVLSGIVALKMSYAESVGVNLEYSVIGQGVIKANTADVIEILSVTLANAIEVAAFSETKIVTLEIKHIEDCVKVLIVNEKTYDSDNKLMKFGDTNGVGLLTVRNKISNYAHASYDVKETDNFYEVSILI